MPQLVLSPSDPSSPQTWKPTGPIPISVRSFGKFPDIACWRPGDLILVSAVKPDLIARSIRSVQIRGGYHQDDARWEHAAVYIGAGAICEATRQGVQPKPIYEYIGQHLIRVRRNQKLTVDEQWRVAVEALIKQDFSYSFWSAAALLAKSRNGFWNFQRGPIKQPKRATICSQLYADAYTKVTGQTLGNVQSGETTPASLSSDSTLVDVQSAWLTIV